MKKYIFALVLVIIGSIMIIKGIFNSNFPFIAFNNTKNITLRKNYLDDNLKMIDIINSSSVLKIKKGDKNSIEINDNIPYEYSNGVLKIQNAQKKENNRKEIFIYITYKDKVDINVENFAGIINCILSEGNHSFSNLVGTLTISTDINTNYDISNTMGIINVNDVKSDLSSLTKLSISNFVGVGNINIK